MFQIILTACGLVAATVIVHVFGLALILDLLGRSHASPPTHFLPISRLLIRTGLLMVVIHLAEISVWAWFYYWQGYLPDYESALYFSGVTYTTVGYGDLVLPPVIRLFGPVEGLIGILMCGLSAGIFFALVSRIYSSHFIHNPKILHSSKHPHVRPADRKKTTDESRQDTPNQHTSP